MELNYLLIICALIILFTVIRGARRGMLRIIYGMIAWIFFICFINIASGYICDYLSTTALPETFQGQITDHLTERYKASEAQEEGSGTDSLLLVVPSQIKETVEGTIQSSIDAAINLISSELTQAAIRGLAVIISIVAGIVIIFVLDKLIKAIGLMPGIKDVNRLLGVIAGFIEGMLLIWIGMYIASCFPATLYGQFVLENTAKSQLLCLIYQNNIIAGIIG